jgi:signal transduction histidine kinase
MDDLLDRAPAGFLSFGDDGRITLANATLLDMLGRRAGDVVVGHLDTLLTPGSRIFYQTHWFPLLRMTGRTEEIFMLLRSADGSDVGVLVNAQRHERNGATAYDCVVMRVRERQKYEGELLEARRAADRARNDVEAQKAELQRAYDQLESQAVELEAQQQLLQEQAAEMEQTADVLEAANEALQARSEEAERLRAVAEEANHAKSAFLAVMSHELRTPLNAIAGYVQILELGIHGPVTQEQLDILERIGRAERHLLRLVNDVLNLARIEAGHVDYRIEDVAVADVAAAVLPMIEPQAATRGLDLTASVPPELRVRADRDKAQQLLINLLGNAVKFTPTGSVSLTAAPAEDDRVEIRITDTGIGIPADRLDSIFEPFVQVDSSRSRAAEGSGLGLAISRDLARGMGGDLTAESTPGHGSTFILTLPAANARPH